MKKSRAFSYVFFMRAEFQDNLRVDLEKGAIAELCVVVVSAMYNTMLQHLYTFIISMMP